MESLISKLKLIWILNKILKCLKLLNTETYCFFSLFLAHLSQRLIWWAYRIGRAPSSVAVVVHSLNIFSSETTGPKLNFNWSFYGIGEWKFAQVFLVTWPRWPPCTYMYMAKNLNLLRNQKADVLETWYAASDARVLLNLLKWLPWPWPTLRQGQIWSLIHFYGKRYDQRPIIVEWRHTPHLVIIYSSWYKHGYF